MATKAIPVVAAKVASTQTNFPVYIKPSAMTGWGSLTTAEANSIRFYSDSGLTTELAREVVSADEIHVKVPSLTTTTTIYADYDGIRSDYAASDTYGRNNVWTGHSGVWHGEGTADAKGVNDLTLTGSGSYTSGKLGNAFTTSSASGQYWRTSITPTGLPTGGNTFSVSYWVKYTTMAAFNMPFTFGTDSANRGYFAPFSEGASPNDWWTFWAGGVGFGDINPTTPDLSDGNWYYAHTTYDGSTHRMYIDGTLIGSKAYTGSNILTSYLNICKHIAVTTLGINGQVDEARIRTSTVSSADWITTEYNNQSDVGTFWGTVTDVAAGNPTGFFAFF